MPTTVSDTMSIVAKTGRRTHRAARECITTTSYRLLRDAHGRAVKEAIDTTRDDRRACIETRENPHAVVPGLAGLDDAQPRLARVNHVDRGRLAVGRRHD